jgi:hypothetical protein
MSDKIAWYEFTNAKAGKAPPKWARTLGVTDDGRIFVPAAISGRSDMEVFLCAGYDGTPACYQGKHLFVPLDWLEREFPSGGDVYEIVRSAAEKAHTG